MGASLADLCQAVQTGEVSAETLVDCALAGIAAVNPALNAVVQLAPEAARETAREADRARARNEPLGPLHGIPMTIKDSLDTAGIVTTGGTVGRRNFVPERDAPVVDRLRRAGAILLGKTNTSELTLSYQTNNAIYGRTSNPYDLTHTSGGSSGGSAAIVSSGAVPFDIGSDTGGSLRIPAHYCGIAALKPTEGRVPRTGHIISFGGYLDRLTTIGPIARSVRDLELILPIIAGPDGRDPAVVPMPLRRADAVQLNGLRIAIHLDNGLAQPTAAVVDTVRRAAAALTGVVASVKDMALPLAAQAPGLFADLYAADGGAWRRRILLAAGTIASAEAPTLGLPAAGFSALLEEWDRFRSEMLVSFEAYDVIVCPVTATAAPLHGEGVASAFSYTQIFSLTGWPCVVVRGGTDGRLPVGLQIVARPWREDVALRVAGHLEAAMGGWQKPDLIATTGEGRARNQRARSVTPYHNG